MIILNFKRMRRKFKEHSKKCGLHFSKSESIKFFITMLFDYVKYGSDRDDFFEFRFYEKSSYAKKEFLTIRKWWKVIKEYNDPEYLEVFDNKCMFAEKYKKFFGREWIDLKDCSYEGFKDFCKKHEMIFIKPQELYQGIGISKLSVKTDADIEKVFEANKGKSIICEEALSGQHCEMAEFNPGTVNTIRVYTIIKNKKVYVPWAFIRMGIDDRGIDNFCNGGMCASVDIETGVVCSSATNTYGERIIVHPISKKQIIGFKVPYWDNVKNTCIEAAKITPQIRYVGWDVAIKNDGSIILIEGNQNTDRNFQSVSQKGWSSFLEEE